MGIVSKRDRVITDFPLKRRLYPIAEPGLLCVRMTEVMRRKPRFDPPCPAFYAGVFLAVLLLAASPAHAAWEPDFWAGDCNCSAKSIPPVTMATAWIDDSQTYFYGVACDYGHYGNDLEAGGKAAHIQIRWDTPEAIAKRQAEKNDTVSTTHDSVQSERTSRVIEYTPPGPDYASILYERPSVTHPSSMLFSGERAIVYKSRYHIEIFGDGYDITDADLKTMMDDSVTCGKAMVDRQEIRADRMAMETTQKSPGFDPGMAMASTLIVGGVFFARRR